MIAISVPGVRIFRFEHLVLDYNGTLAVDGEPLPGVRERLGALATSLQVHVVTADTFGRVREGLAGVPCTIHILSPGRQALAKLRYVTRLGLDKTCAIGNGRNDQRMLRHSALGIAVLGAEGAARESLGAADVVVPDVCSGLDLLLKPTRLVATLRT